MKYLLSIVFFICTVSGLSASSDTYTNPVIGRSMPDPTVIRAGDGYFYLYATEDIRNTPIYRSTDLVNWIFVHGWDAENETNGRVLLLNQIKWDRSGWPYVEKNCPAEKAPKPVFGINSIDTLNEVPVQLQRIENQLIFQSPLPADVKIYTLCGQLVTSFSQSIQFQAPLLRGGYIVQVKTAIHSIVKTIFI